MQHVIDELPDGFVILDKDRRVLSANPAFLDMVQLATEDQAKNEPVSRWLGRGSVDTDILFANLVEHGFLLRHASLARGEYGASRDVEVTGVYISSSDETCFGLILRKVADEVAAAAEEAIVAGSHSAEKLKGLVGRTPLREVVRQTTDIVERMCIEAALELTGDNRASAAEILGVSRQSLYVKLRRHQIGELGDDGN